MARTKSTMYSLMVGAIRIEAASARNWMHVVWTVKRRFFTGSGIEVGARCVRHAGQIEHHELGRAIGITHDQLHQKPVELGFRQRISSLVFDRILSGQHPEGVGQEDRFVADGDLALLHCLE